MIIRVEKEGAKVGDVVVHYSSEVVPSVGNVIDVAFEGEPLRLYEVVCVKHVLRPYIDAPEDDRTLGDTLEVVVRALNGNINTRSISA